MHDCSVNAIRLFIRYMKVMMTLEEVMERQSRKKEFEQT